MNTPTTTTTRPAPAPRVVMKGLGKTYGSSAHPGRHLWDLLLGRAESGEKFVALRDVSLDLQPGQTLGLIGRNGSGKSTLLQILCGTLTPTTGSVQVNGRIAALLELGSGFNPEFTGRENVYLNGSLLGMSRRQVQEAFDSICAFAEIGSYIDQPVKTYSSGMFVRLAFAVVIHTQPDLLVVDEALAVGDARFQAKCLAAIRQLKRQGVAVVLVTHDVSIVRQLCDSAVWLRDGEVAMAGDVNAVTSAYMQYLFGEDEAPSDDAAAPLATTAHAACAPGVPVASPAAVLDTSRLSDVPEAAWQGNAAPISRWGSAPQTITGCLVQTGCGQVSCLWEGQCRVTLTVRFRLQRPVPWATLSVAVAIKDVRGNDLLVTSSWDRGWRFSPLPLEHDCTVGFTFDNPLNAGKYTLVAAVEDRGEQLPHYYDFVEGVQFVEVMQDNPYMGMVVVPVQVHAEHLIAAN